MSDINGSDGTSSALGVVRCGAQALLFLEIIRMWVYKLWWRTFGFSTFAGNETSPESFLLHNALARKPKRIRTAFSPSQLLRLEHAFEKNHYVVGAERKQLAHSLSLTETQVRALSFSNTLYLEDAVILFRNFMRAFMRFVCVCLEPWIKTSHRYKCF